MLLYSVLCVYIITCLLSIWSIRVGESLLVGYLSRSNHFKIFNFLLSSQYFSIARVIKLHIKMISHLTIDNTTFVLDILKQLTLVYHMRLWVCVCLGVCARARVCVYSCLFVSVCVIVFHVTHTHTHIYSLHIRILRLE